MGLTTMNQDKGKPKVKLYAWETTEGWLACDKPFGTPESELNEIAREVDRRRLYFAVKAEMGDQEFEIVYQ